MTAAHFAVALAIKSRIPKAPTAALVFGAFIPDFVWIVLATVGIEPTKREIFFDDWSHSLLSILVYASVFALLFRADRRVALAMWMAVFSHFILDLPVHPKALALYPHSSAHLGLGLSDVAPMNYWYIQLVVTLVLLAIYCDGTRRLGVVWKPVLASCALVLGWHIALMPG